MITLDSVSKTFSTRLGDTVHALQGIDLAIGDGDLLVVTGPSGSGKSTLLYTIGGLLEPTSGGVRFGDIELYELSPVARSGVRREQIGFVFQTFNLVPYLSCVENVALPAVLAGKPRREANERAIDMLVRLGLSERLEHPPSALSVGERQRVGLVRAIINGPKVLLADEPTGNLDPATRNEVIRLLIELNAAGQTIVLVTHDLVLAEVGQRVVKLRSGQIEGERAIAGSGPNREDGDENGTLARLA